MTNRSASTRASEHTSMGMEVSRDHLRGPSQKDLGRS